MQVRQLNFSAGPSRLPESVIEKVSDSLMCYGNSGVGILELGHRTKYFQRIIDEIKDKLVEFLLIPNSHDILLMTGGATAQFSAVPMNLGITGKKAGYIISGHWANLASKEAERWTEVEVSGSSEALKFKKLPDYNQSSEELFSYVHFTSNNTIYGTQYLSEPNVSGCPLVCDASSDILSRKIDITKYGLIYAGAQKNLGIPGVTLVIVNKEILKEVKNKVPKILDYNTYTESNSLYNTPPVTSIYVMLEVLRWISEMGGLKEIEQRNQEKSKILYDFLDASSHFEPYVTKENKQYRSKMNVVFSLKDLVNEKALLEKLKEEGIIGLEGHRSVGGFRASLYNAISVSEVKLLVDCLKDFELEL